MITEDPRDPIPPIDQLGRRELATLRRLTGQATLAEAIERPSLFPVKITDPGTLLGAALSARARRDLQLLRAAAPWVLEGTELEQVQP